MEPIADPFEFRYVLELIKEDVAALPLTQDTLRRKLDLLIADALSDLTGPNLELARENGDLDDASGASHLLTDYPASKDKKRRHYGLTTNQEAAADWLLTLYLARDQLDLGFGIIDAAIESIEAKGWIVLAWRFWGAVFDLDQRRRQARTAASDPDKHERLLKRARLLGAYRKDPQRRRTHEPKPAGGIGKPPAYLLSDERRAYRELANAAAPGVLTASDNHIVEIGAVLLAKFRRRECGKVAEIGLLVKCLSQLGMTPADRSKVGVEPQQTTTETDPWARFDTDLRRHAETASSKDK